MLRSLILVFGLACAALSASAHEFWLEPHVYRIAPGETAKADALVGQTMSGSTYSYLPRNFTRFDIVHDGVTSPVEGRAGDLPAFGMTLEDPGLYVIVHQTRAYTLTYKEWEKFLKFAAHKDFATAEADHTARGLPQTGFRERYVRYAKALIAVGDGAGSDAETGMETEIVAEANPYVDDLSGGLPVRVLYQGAPRADAQVELFEKAPDGTVEVTLHRTDGDGRAVIPVKPGHAYLVDAVVLRPLEPETEGDPVWESLWASLVFQAPE